MLRELVGQLQLASAEIGQRLAGGDNRLVELGELRFTRGESFAGFGERLLALVFVTLGLGELALERFDPLLGLGSGDRFSPWSPFAAR